MLSKAVEEFLKARNPICHPVLLSVVGELFTHPDSPIKKAIDMAEKMEHVMCKTAHCDRCNNFRQAFAALKESK